eukprot:tig00000396_g24874.t1
MAVRARILQFSVRYCSPPPRSMSGAAGAPALQAAVVPLRSRAIAAVERRPWWVLALIVISALLVGLGQAGSLPSSSRPASRSPASLICSVLIAGLGRCAILGSVSHKGVGGVYHVERNGSTYSILMELCSGGDLQSLVDKGPVPEATALGYMSQICVSVEHLHRRRILHRGNPLPFPSRTPRSSIHVPDQPAFFSPELMIGHAYGPGADVWACGLILYMLLTGRHPFIDADGTLNLVRLSKGDVGAWPQGVSPDARAIVRACLEPEPKRRPNVSQVRTKRAEKGLTSTLVVEPSRFAEP